MLMQNFGATKKSIMVTLKMAYSVPTPETSGGPWASVRRQDISDRLGNFRELQTMDQL